MKAYAILDGGGVKGAALAGCLKAAEECKVEFLGYGGTSAGSIVALLAAVGYSPDEIRDVMIEELDFTELLDDNGKALVKVQNGLQTMLTCFDNPSSFVKAIVALTASWSQLKQMNTGFGLYHGEKMRAFLLNKIWKKLPHLKNQNSITFNDLAKEGCKELKVVASDIRSSKPVVFSNAGGEENGGDVINAVRASVSYPFVFQPVQVGDHYLVDGGLCSNLPVFLFEQERNNAHFPIPVIAFDLVTPTVPLTASYTFDQFCADMLSTAIEASDSLLRSSIQSVYHILIETPAGINTLDFGLTVDRRRELFTKGHSDTHSYFSENLSQWMDARNSVEQLQALRADPQIVNFLLGTMAHSFERETKATSIRANIMLPLNEGKRIVVYQHGMDLDPDCDLELATEGGCSGYAWKSRQPAWADLVEAKTDFAQWNMNQAEQNKVRNDRKAMFSIPIFALSSLASGSKKNIADFPILGILSLDTDTLLQDTLWKENKTSNQDFLAKAKYWADVFGKLLTERGIDL